jgi:hypothetical protein
VTIEQAIVRLDQHKHWRIQCENSNGNRRYSCTIWGAGKRVTASARTVLAAAQGAIEKLDDVRLRLVH